MIVSGADDYADPWHPFDATSSALAESLASVLPDVTTRRDVDAALAGLGAGIDLAVLNFGNAGIGTPSGAARAGLVRFLEGGGGVLAMHVVATAFTDWARWEDLLGGRWIRGTTYHPPQGVGTVRVAPGQDGQGMEFEIDDEFYVDLRVAPSVEISATHVLDGVEQPLAWRHEVGAGRLVYLGLGHDAGAYRADGLRRLVTDGALWAARR